MPIEVFIFRLACALLAGIIIGTQRELKQRQAGLTTNSLVAVGACIFILISESVIMSAKLAGGPVNNDNLRVLSQVVTGIGFLGAGVIMKNGLTIHGLSSAATIWCSAAVGCLCGYGMWVEALIAVTIIILINWGLKSIEIYIKHLRHSNEEEDTRKKKTMIREKLLMVLVAAMLCASCGKDEASDVEPSADRFLAGTSWSHSFDTVLTVNDNQWNETIVSNLVFSDDGVHSYLNVTTMITSPFNESTAHNTPFDYTYDSMRNEGQMIARVERMVIPFVYNPLDTTIGLSVPLGEDVFRFVEMHCVVGL